MIHPRTICRLLARVVKASAGGRILVWSDRGVSSSPLRSDYPRTCSPEDVWGKGKAVGSSQHRRLCCESANDNSPLPAALVRRGHRARPLSCDNGSKRAIYWLNLSSHGRSARINLAGVFVTPMPKQCREKTTRSHLRVANRQRSSVSLPPNAWS